MQGTPSTERIMKNVKGYVKDLDQNYNRVYSIVSKVPTVFATEELETRHALKELNSKGIALNIDARRL